MSFPTPNTPKNVHAFLQALEHPSKDLTEWEEGFLDSIKRQFERRGKLSDAQFEVLDRIYTEKTD